MSWQDASDDELLLAAARRDGDAFEAFFRRHAPHVLAFFAARVEDPEVAADLMAETFAGVVVSLSRYQRRPEPPTSWLFGIARYKLADYARRQTVQRKAMRRLGIERRELDDLDLAQVEHLSELAATGVVVRDELAALPATQRLAVEAHVVHERSYQEIATDANVSEAVVRQRVSRGLRRMKEGLRKA
ncbi:MAG: RNA polymerase sigma factor [Solirubrobacteraceae bacterium]